MLETIAKNTAADAIAAQVTKLRAVDSVNQALSDWDNNPQDQAVTFNSAVDGVADLAEAPEFQVKSGEQVAGVQFLATNDTLYGTHLIAPGDRESFTNNGIFRAIGVTISVDEAVE